MITMTSKNPPRFGACWFVVVHGYDECYVFNTTRGKAVAAVCRALADVRNRKWSETLRRLKIRREPDQDWRAPYAGTGVAYTQDSMLHLGPSFNDSGFR